MCSYRDNTGFRARGYGGIEVVGVICSRYWILVFWHFVSWILLEVIGVVMWFVWGIFNPFKKPKKGKAVIH